MCTAIAYKAGDFYFGRNLDYEKTFGEEVTVMPRRFPLAFRHGGGLDRHYALVGVAHVTDGYPLYYDAVNEKGLAMAGLNFTRSAVFHDAAAGKKNVAAFELIAWVLSQCADIAQATKLLENANITPATFRESLPVARLHWLLADKNGSLVLESMEDGLHIHPDPVGVLTNEPPFPVQMLHLNDYMQLSAAAPTNRFSPALSLQPYSRGMGALGLPGDLSSASRFVRAAFVKENSVSGHSAQAELAQAFHILSSVSQQRGCCRLEQGVYEFTQYSACCNASKGIYYYTTYENSQITAIDMHREDLEGNILRRYPLRREQGIFLEK